MLPLCFLSSFTLDAAMMMVNVVLLCLSWNFFHFAEVNEDFFESDFVLCALSPVL